MLHTTNSPKPTRAKSPGTPIKVVGSSPILASCSVYWGLWAAGAAVGCASTTPSPNDVQQDEDARPWKHHMMQWNLLYVILFPLNKCSGLGN